MLINEPMGPSAARACCSTCGLRLDTEPNLAACPAPIACRLHAITDSHRWDVEMNFNANEEGMKRECRRIFHDPCPFDAFGIYLRFAPIADICVEITLLYPCQSV